MKRQTIIKIPEKFVPANEKLENKIFSFELLTPMFGGDAESWDIDTRNPVRSQSVKGMLRFWWRTMQSEENVHQLLYKENKLWGGKKGANNQESNRIQSPVKISVIDQKSNYTDFLPEERNNRFVGVKGDVIPSYVLFPITEKIKNNETVYYINKLTFKLQISYPKQYEQEVMNTLKLWTLFGGVGARTRRGTGSLFCKELLKEFKDENDIKKFIDSFASSGKEQLYPTVKGAVLAVKQTEGDPAEIWHGMLERFGAYRQAPGVGRGRGQQHRPGRSYWPEPDSIRELSGKNAAHHKPEHPDRNWFPRAAFGLPIQFEFRGEPTDPQGKIMLEPNIGTGERWPSPVILKVIKLPNANVYKTVIVLKQKFPASMKIKSNRGLNHILTEQEMPTSRNGKVMKKNDNINGRSIYKHLIDFLKLTEVN